MLLVMTREVELLQLVMLRETNTRMTSVILEDWRTRECRNWRGEQITRTHEAVANIDQDLSRSEKLLGSLGGMFSKTWKPKKTKAIKGPVITRGNYHITFNLWTLLAGKVSLCLPEYLCWVAYDSFKRKGNHLEQREKLGLASVPKGRSNPRKSAYEPTTALQKVEVHLGVESKTHR
ncbi:hypothetical protein IFM89_005563 [Coptis chinensis]|uniref:t-SNARE coiled-coil homology domain-containing protein n=1 Tax=Coptis chinensis TaxID=261450 RepID=A0A835H1V7_9MAGN|nr:hypothetical protein IFM89_005563 [Coptis chinensis]